MTDKILTCQNCQKTFVYSEYEQKLDARASRPEPLYDPICASLKAQAARRPGKPQK